MELTFRRAVPSDVESLLGMMQAFYLHEGIAFEPARSARALAQLMATPVYGAAYVVEEGGACVGYLAITLGYSLEYGGIDAFLDELFVVEPARGRGIGTAALDFAADACRALGACALHLEVDHQNPRARALYERRGFAPHERYLMTRWL